MIYAKNSIVQTQIERVKNQTGLGQEDSDEELEVDIEPQDAGKIMNEALKDYVAVAVGRMATNHDKIVRNPVTN